jgi:hypothetical protein
MIIPNLAHPISLFVRQVSAGGTQGGLWVIGTLDDVVAVARADAQRVGAETAHVDAYWGVAGWSRTQLLGEIARGSWGLCRGEITDVSTVAPTDGEAIGAALSHLRWRDIIDADPPRLVYAKKSEMTDEDIHREEEQVSCCCNALLAVVPFSAMVPYRIVPLSLCRTTVVVRVASYGCAIRAGLGIVFL